MLKTVAALTIAVAWQGAEPVRLTAQPQKFRTFYSVGDPAVPRALSEPAAPLPVGDLTAMATASDGACWYGTRQGAVRVDSKASAQDRNQYFAGKRYLPDDNVLQLAPDKSGGMWKRTETGVSHVELR